MSASAGIRQYVLDANALISFFENRPGAAPKVRRLFEEAFRLDRPLFLSTVNWGEVFYITWKLHGQMRALEAESKIQQLPVLLIPADFERATRAATLKKKHSLGYADAFAAELAIERNAWLVTADPEFSRLGKELLVYPLLRHEK